MNNNCSSESARKLVIQAVSNPTSVLNLEPQQWDALLRMLRSAKLLARVGGQLKKLDLLRELPDQIVHQLIAAITMATYRRRTALWEINRLERCLAGLGIEVVVLKGCGYILSELAVSEGRLISDVDIMVLRKELSTVEQRLNEGGWQSTKLDKYDQEYYRQWMHEVPPLRHRNRIMEVDLHHNIIPLTCRLKPNADLFFQPLISLDGYRFKVLAPCDMVLHSAAHLFYGSELKEDLRDLVDLDDLLIGFASDEKCFWKKLDKRAVELDLQRPLYYALHYCHQMLNTPIPGAVLNSCRKYGPSRVVLWIMDKLVPAAIMPEHPDYPSYITAMARWFLFVRSHYLKMPLGLLIPHLLRKSIKRSPLILVTK